MMPLILLITFTACAYAYASATKKLQALDKLRLDKTPPLPPDPVLGAATEFMKKMGLAIAPGGEELKAFCEKNGLAGEYRRANFQLYGAIVLAFLCIFFVIKAGASVKP